MPKASDDNLIVGIDTADDAAVYKLSDDIATIQTLDFFTPVVDDPYTFGQIAAANSLSDVYAMGGKPVVALNIVCFPNCLPIEILGEILKGGADKVIEAGAVVVGGHSVQDDEPKYGLSVTGVVHPNKVFKNYGGENDDVLILTKPLGTGIINTAIKAEMASEKAYEKAVKVMATLNKYAGEISQKYPITSCTDITGFGFMGHVYEMASGSNKTFRIFKDLIPYMEEAKEYAEMGLVPAGSYSNREYIKGKYFLDNVENWMEDILFDPQTSGGLMVTCNKEYSQKLMEELSTLDLESSVVGEVEEFKDYYIVVE